MKRHLFSFAAEAQRINSAVGSVMPDWVEWTATADQARGRLCFIAAPKEFTLRPRPKVEFSYDVQEMWNVSATPADLAKLATAAISKLPRS